MVVVVGLSLKSGLIYLCVAKAVFEFPVLLPLALSAEITCVRPHTELFVSQDK